MDESRYIPAIKLANNTDIAALAGNGFYWGDTDGNSGTMVNSPFARSFAMLTQTCYSSGTDIRRPRLAFSADGAMKLFDDRVTAGTGGKWYDVVTSSNFTTIVTKIGTATVGSTSKPVYLNAGVPTAISATVGSATRPVYLNGGTITAGTYTFGNASGNAPVSNGTCNVNLNADLLDGYHALSFPRVIQGMVNTTGTKYILLGTFDYENASTTGGASFNVRGAIGRFGGAQKNVVDISVGNRDGVGFQGFVSNMNPDDWDIGVNNARQIFLILKYQWLTYDIEVFSRQGTLVDGTSVTPTDTNFVLLSASALVNRFENGRYLGSAAKLTTSRKLWGQDFDGSGDVSGRWELNGKASGSLSIYEDTSSDGTDCKVIQTWGSKPLFINPLGNNVAIGRNSGYNSGFKLDVNGSMRVCNYAYIGSTASDGYLKIFATKPYIDFHYGKASSQTTRLIEEASGRLAVLGTLRVSVGMYSDGYVSAKGQNTSSDERLKRNLMPMEISLTQIADAPAVSFDWRKDGSHDVGSVAQYWRGVNPMLTPEGPDGYLTLQYGKAALLSVISVAKKLRQNDNRVKELEKEITELKRKIEILERRTICQ